MEGRHHVILGELGELSWIVLTGSVLSPLIVAGAVVAAWYGSLLPDMDAPNAKIHFATFGILKIFRRLFGWQHRGWTHGPLLWVVGLLPWFPIWIQALCVGALVHIAADWATPSGVPLLWPRSETRYSAPVTVTTGSWQERWLVRCIVVVWVIFVLPILVLRYPLL